MVASSVAGCSPVFVNTHARKEAEARVDQFATQQPFGLKMDGYHCAG